MIADTRSELDRAIKCTCGSTAVIDTKQHASRCHRRMWREYTDAVDGQLNSIVQAAIKHGVNDQVAEAIAHAELIMGMRR